MSEKQSDLTPLLCCPSCGCEAELSMQYGDGWKKHVVHCDGVFDDDKAEYLQDPCGLEISAYTEERSTEDMYKQWNSLPRAT